MEQVQQMDKLLAILEVDEDLKVYCQAEGCTATVYKRIQVVQVNEKIIVLGSTCYSKLYGSSEHVQKSSYYTGSESRKLTEEELSCLEDDFRHYKTKWCLPDLFGRDVPYNHPNTLPSVKAEELWHIHLLDGENSWPVHCKKQDDKTSDDHLVYCPAYNTPNCLLLIAILAPDAHAQARKNQIMVNLAKMAENFRMKF